MFLKLLWTLVMVGAGLGALQFFDVMSTAETAPQQAAGAAMACAWAVVPYCFARAVQEFGRGTED